MFTITINILNTGILLYIMKLAKGKMAQKVTNNLFVIIFDG